MKKNYTTLTLMILSLCFYELSGRGQKRLGGNINGTAPGEESGHSVSVSANGKGQTFMAHKEAMGGFTNIKTIAGCSLEHTLSERLTMTGVDIP